MGSYAAIQQMNNMINYYQVESVLHDYPKVLEAGVIVKSQEQGNDKLMVYLALQESFSCNKEREEYCEEVEGFIRKNFSFKIPIRVFIKEKLPMTKSGKILRSILYDYN